MLYRNPIIPGFNPDPSICRKGDDFYLVTSTFEFFPGVPVYHSKNLVNWEHIGYCLDRDSQLPLQGCWPSAGIYAPTIRYHEGMFYMTTTNVSGGGNFIVHTEDPAKGWSEPAWVHGQGGIDPSLFFDDDGKVYFTSTGEDENGSGIRICELNPMTGELLSDSILLSHGTGGKCPEAPHIYKINGYYYLMMAEGGTEYGHMETIFRAKNPYGPYESCPHNPIITQRNTCGTPIQATGHADIIEDGNGNWWMVCLGIRPIGAQLHNLGRETFLVPVIWENGWPVVVNNEPLGLEIDAPLPYPETVRPVCLDLEENFDGSSWNVAFNFLRNPQRENYRLDTQNHCLHLQGTEKRLSDSSTNPTFMGVRQQDHNTCVTSVLTGELAEGGAAGLSAYYTHCYHYDICLQKKDGVYQVAVRRRLHDLDLVTACTPIAYNGKIELKIQAAKDFYQFSYRLDDGEFIPLDSAMTAGLCTEGLYFNTFTGTYIGMFAENTEAVFDSFHTTQPVR
ncbi:MAG TPA: glycoside hydrolase family 43 protein [Firmicutes bacterium]|nr:glycoside hydrolase family 43 protein [Bacillota bacterium]